jgi:Sigma-70, region 4
MTQESVAPTNTLFPPQPIPAGMQAFSHRLHNLLDGHPKDDATVSQALDGMDDMFDFIAAGLYSLASMLVGEGEDSIRLVEMAVATADISACEDAAETRKSSRRALCIAALDTIAQRDPGSLAAPQNLTHVATCIQDDELDAVGVSHEELMNLLAGPDRDRLRNWLTGLPPVLRVIFVLRAVAGFSAAETAEMLSVHGGSRASGWNSAAVRELFRQGLCSLASQLLHASATR